MKKIIHHLRKQPEEVRRHVLHIAMLVVALIMLGLWALSLSKSFSGPDAKEKIKQDLKPFSTLKDSIVDTYNDSPVSSGIQ